MTRRFDRISLSKESFLSLCLLSAAFGYLLFGFWEWWDMPLHDGTLYYQRARQWTWTAGSLDRDWSPIYVVFYHFFQKIVPSSNPFLIYALHRVLILYGIVLFFWLLSSRYFSWELAVPLSLLVACNTVLFGNFQVVHSVGLLYALAMLWMATRQAQTDRLLLLGLTACGYFVRPEFGLVFLLAATLTGRELAKGRIGKAEFRLGWGAALCLILTVGVWWGSHNPPGPGRLLRAFSQQAAWVRQGENSVVAGWQHMDRTRELYGNVATLGEATLSNPAEFTRHLANNLLELPRAGPQILEPRSVLPAASRVLFTVVLVLGLVLAGPPRQAWSSFWIPAVGLALSGIAASLVTRPTGLYLLTALPLLLLGPALLLCRKLPRAAFSMRSRRLLLCFLALGMAVALVLARSDKPAGQPVVRLSEKLESVYPRIPRRILAFSAASYCLLWKGCSWQGGPEQLDGLPGFREILDSNQVELVVIDAAMRQAAAELGYAELSRFEADPAGFGFQLAGEATGGVTESYFRESGLDTRSRLYVRNTE